MARSKSSRLRARSSRRRGLRQTRRRSPGKSGLAISATASGSSWSGFNGAGPFVPTGFSNVRRSVLFRAEIQSRSAGATEARIRAVVSMPRSPTRAIRSMPKRVRSFRTWLATVAGSPVLPANTSTATGQPASEQSRPKAICFLPLLPSRLCPKAARGQQRPSR